MEDCDDLKKVLSGDGRYLFCPYSKESKREGWRERKEKNINIILQYYQEERRKIWEDGKVMTRQVYFYSTFQQQGNSKCFASSVKVQKKHNIKTSHSKTKRKRNKTE